jgi:hypothetical protein
MNVKLENGGCIIPLENNEATRYRIINTPSMPTRNGIVQTIYVWESAKIIWFGHRRSPMSA